MCIMASGPGAPGPNVTVNSEGCESDTFIEIMSPKYSSTLTQNQCLAIAFSVLEFEHYWKLVVRIKKGSACAQNIGIESVL